MATPPCAAKAAIPCVPAEKRNPLCGFPFSSGFYRSTDTRTVCGWSFFILSAKDVRTWKNLWNS
ncbi:hypothetical protein DW855_14030 [Faecalibacterium prausnitzii]|uniref:Uncharacterized protein n=1 Tax=Faecalibacterium prausnitzii TaxID=853 RepID=A0A3E2VU96_9FIRM|nr:hypothetical protein DWZ25_07695 [Faecalibacterium prausnitzii]RGC14664.1 hypothetical protein DW855_14030 [Faecalibacterium prausnitzii]